MLKPRQTIFRCLRRDCCFVSHFAAAGRTQARFAVKAIRFISGRDTMGLDMYAYNHARFCLTVDTRSLLISGF
jgi:hypothetical protein